MKFSAVVTSHANPAGLRHILGQLRYQTRPPDEVLVYYSETPHHQILRLREEFPEAHFYAMQNRNDWGHEKRAFGMQAASGDFVGFFNDDDEYSMSYIEAMMWEQNRSGADVVYCAWNKIPNCDFCLGSSTSGNYIFRRSLGIEAGYRERNYEADGHFIDALRLRAGEIARVDEVLYFHNAGLRS